MESATQVQILDEFFYFSLLAHFLGKGINPSFLFFTSYGLLVGQAEFISLDNATSLGEGKLWIKTSRTPLKIDFESHSDRG